MTFIVGLLTFVMVLNCAVLVFLVLIQLPKKDAGAGLAFGGGATDALFGAGSGTILTKVTKYATAMFFVLAFVLAVIQRHRSTASTTEFERRLSKPGATMPAAPAPSTPATPQPATPPSPNPEAAPATQPPAGLLSEPAPAPANP